MLVITRKRAGEWAFVAAAARFKAQHGGILPGSISLLITGDEEGPAINGTRKVLEWMAANGEQPDHAVVLVPELSSIGFEAN